MKNLVSSPGPKQRPHPIRETAFVGTFDPGRQYLETLYYARREQTEAQVCCFLHGEGPDQGRTGGSPVAAPGLGQATQPGDGPCFPIPFSFYGD